ncbi:Fic/DOC family protein [Clostridium sp. MT-14]|jgi:cell filamentation protein|uniref:protein adenylyltransferase n=1 Tax=Clostridium aromativorans TaxID=2836848 RepID=A0ABS8NAC9_9CLOT|nr:MULTISPECIES: Fic family protein [Clostridium]KAA8667711.1 cell filamentation protein Fic [Clostridium sp. HV4-5-A1G]MCC9296781.1 Fic family protein [Clostridium aromativorans]CAB1249303.1 Cell filamentation protein Fic [Clostridiaceae bacterium BL-3]
MYDISGNNEYRSLYYYKDVDVLKNKFNIKDADKLEKMERILSSQRLSELAINPIKGNFDIEHLCEIHKYIFQDIYEWAGQLRNEDIFKGGEFAPSYLLRDALENEIFKPLKKDDYLKNMSRRNTSDKIAFYMSQLNFAHPFREGNGRTQREFVRNLAFSNGYILEWDGAEPEELLEATIEATRKYKYEHLSKIIFRLLK